PTGLRSRVPFDPRSDGLDDEDVREPRNDGLPAWAELLRLGGHEAQGALDPFHLRRHRSLDVNDSRQQRHEVMRGRMVEVNGSADQRGCRAAAPVAEDRVALAHVLVMQLVEPRGGDAECACQTMTLSVWDEREITSPERDRLCVLDVEKTAAGHDDVEAQ